MLEGDIRELGREIPCDPGRQKMAWDQASEEVWL